MVLDLVLGLILVDLSDVGIREQSLSFCLHSQEIYAVDFCVCVRYVVEMQLERLFGKFMGAGQRHVFFHAGLLPEDGH